MIYDTFPFFNELELLEVRLHELDSVVDKFVLVEATRTHSNKPKPLHYAENRDSFRSFHHKITHIVVDDMPDSADAWVGEHFQRECIGRGLSGCKPDDIIMVSDADEIPRAAKVKQAAAEMQFCTGALAGLWHGLLKTRIVTRACRSMFKKSHPLVSVFEHRNYAFYLNCTWEASAPWPGTRMVYFRDFASADDLHHWKGVPIPDGGWHFTFMGGIERVRTKLAAFAHQEMNIPQYNDPKILAEALRQGKSVFDSEKMKVVQIDGSYPEYLQKNAGRFSGLIAPAT